MLSKIQQEIVNTTNSKVVVISAAASGKTAVITERVKHLLSQGERGDRIVVITFTNAAADEMKKRIGNNEPFVGTIHSYANRLLIDKGFNTSDCIENENFDKLFKMIKNNPEVIVPVDHLLLDEAQDSSDIQYEFLLDMIKPKNYFIVGDYRQCQPAGTKVLLRGGTEKNIEDIKIGDDLVYYDNKNGRCSSLNATTWNALHKKVENISERTLNNEEIITITSESGLTSTYTQNHRTFVSINTETKFQYGVYLMCDKNNRFRVGKIPFRGTKTKNGNPWREKMIAEGCNKIWLLKLFETDKEARVFEQRISYFYQIPQICWQLKKVQWTKEDIDFIYEGIDTHSNAKKCLSDFHRNILYPIIDLDESWSASQKFASNATSQIYACNIIPEAMNCVCYGSKRQNHSNKHFENIIAVSYRNSSEKVYSLKVDGGTYIADGIATHNSIYEWNGARPDILEDLKDKAGVKTYNLNENYRNGYKILNFAREIIGKLGFDFEDNSKSMTGDLGKVLKAEYKPSIVLSYIQSADAPKDWFVLTRTNAQLDDIYRFLIKNGIPCDTFKRSSISAEEFKKKMNENTVKVLTIHAAKGLEAKNVIVIGTNNWKPEEVRIQYVAATRAKELLIWMKEPPRGRRAYINWD